MVAIPEESKELIRQILGDNYIKIEVQRLLIEDNMNGECLAELRLFPGITVAGMGVGQFDAVFCALKNHLAEEYQSLKSIVLEDFKVTASRETGKHKDGADALCEVSLLLRNSYGNQFSFSSASRSLAASVARTVCRGVEHFLNAERAYIALHKALEDARNRDRQDLVTRFTQELSVLVKFTSYAEIIERLSQESSL